MLGRLYGPELDPAALPGDAPLPAHVRVRTSGWLTGLAGLFLGPGRRAAAVTLGRTIVMAPGVRLTGRLLRHELAHVRQWESSAFFPLAYVLGHLRHGYIDNPYEIEARAAEDGSPPDPDAPTTGSSR